MIRQERVPGSRKDSFMSTRPVMHCDSMGCHEQVEGTPGSDEDFLRERAQSLGWRSDAKSDQDQCPDCRDDVDDKVPFAQRSGVAAKKVASPSSTKKR